MKKIPFQIIFTLTKQRRSARDYSIIQIYSMRNNPWYSTGSNETTPKALYEKQG
jgi:hypothetical protein